ncbi:hypothetical protein PR202_ga07421 [Eleusine coracana subsp. coracana]|uniref:Uncharacterized protein n=1 Tax=Eleusine coracana subsp. coracana TaxID=191504 RepID=A0AAV5BXJ1_ELECO|nr:hypothetical protein PR202_ga07421 [Eleusine coracana subsp. coracana]
MAMVGTPSPHPPPHVLLYVHHRAPSLLTQAPSGQLGQLDAEEVEVEEAPSRLICCPLAILWFVKLELVGAERHDARSRASCARGRAEQREVEDEQRPGGRARAGLAGEGRRAEGREHRGGGEADHAELIDDGAERDGPEAAGEGVGDEAADDRGEVGRAGEVGERVGRLHQRQVQLLHQVRDQAAGEAGPGKGFEGHLDGVAGARHGSGCGRAGSADREGFHVDESPVGRTVIGASGGGGRRGFLRHWGSTRDEWDGTYGSWDSACAVSCLDIMSRNSVLGGIVARVSWSKAQVAAQCSSSPGPPQNLPDS